MKQPWQTSQGSTRRFLGYEQAWDIVLALVLYLRTLQFQVPDPQGLHSMLRKPSRTSSQEECETLQNITQDMLDMVLRLTTLFAWLGIPPSLCYSVVTSHGAYLLGLWDYGPYQELVCLSASCQVSFCFVNAMTTLSTSVKVVLPAPHSSWEFGSWHWPRCGVPDALHKDIAQLNIFLDFWNSEDALFNPLLPSEPVDVEQAYSILLKVGLLAHDCVYSLHLWKHEYKHLGSVPRELYNNSLIDSTPTLVKLELSTADQLSQARHIFPPPFHTLSSPSNLPSQPYSTCTALARVPSMPTATEVQ
jgi:hypothetical protein